MPNATGLEECPDFCTGLGEKTEVLENFTDIIEFWKDINIELTHIIKKLKHFVEHIIIYIYNKYPGIPLYNANILQYNYTRELSKFIKSLELYNNKNNILEDNILFLLEDNILFDIKYIDIYTSSPQQVINNTVTRGVNKILDDKRNFKEILSKK